jgi:integrase/recombinase XerD
MCSKYRYFVRMNGIPISSYQSYLKIERGLSKNTVQNYSFDIERLCLSNNKWN